MNVHPPVILTMLSVAHTFQLFAQNLKVLWSFARRFLCFEVRWIIRTFCWPSLAASDTSWVTLAVHREKYPRDQIRLLGRMYLHDLASFLDCVGGF